ncbi:hypothetical protein [Sphingomonas psychrotolerans]|uniref:Uncharacterized protein n=1 Tax=Sphingomonas psychrotolerans TaxID=1327635 RepID=A0A2K8MCJ6_9SPHN|nr:hypothetical protein [Sphingomonas psychrotolerans]ATY31622.1 hypothetical protein CVN68_06255 [Sphingomonas psychrotolerans]
MRAWLAGAFGLPLLLGCGQQTSSDAHQAVSNPQQIARAAAGKAQPGTPEPKTLEITGYYQTIAPDDDEEPPVAI